MSTEELHGLKGKSSWSAPKLVAESTQANRADQGNKTLANEYLDDDAVLDAKLDMVVDMIKKSKMLITYTGAGLSKSSGIPDYATKAENSVVNMPKLMSPIDAQPTYAHLVLTALYNAGYLKYWVQQNHDGLPQKGGFPQEKINEIHGAWFDPSNPVVQFSGKLRSDLFQWMIDLEEKTDMCLCLGTSLSGMNADRMANTPAKKSLKKKALGTVIINIQKTPLDSKCAVRIWATLDNAFKILAQKLSLTVPTLDSIKIPQGDVFHVPYDSNGKLDHNSCMVLDLSEGKEIKIPVPGAMNEGCTGEILGKTRFGHWEVQTLEKKCFKIRRLLGWWWIDSALRGAVDQLPVINANPVILDASHLKSSLSNINNNATSDVENHLSQLSINNNHSNAGSSNLPKTISILQSHGSPANNEDEFHDWSLYLEPGAEKYVSEIAYTLHPTFNPPEVTLTEAPFSISRRGWGVFTIKFAIKLKPEYGSKVISGKHELVFKGEGNNVSATAVNVV